MASEKIIKQWFSYAARDLKMAKHSLAHDKNYKSISAFLAEQCAEKAIKGFLSFHKIRFKKFHNFEYLSEEVAKVDQTLAKLIYKRKSLGRLAVDYRYPDAELTPLTVAKTKTAIKHAEELFNECHRRVYGAP